MKAFLLIQRTCPKLLNQPLETEISVLEDMCCFHKLCFWKIMSQDIPLLLCKAFRQGCLVKILSLKICSLTHHSLHVWCVVVQLLSHVWLLATLWIAAHQVSLSSTISQSLLQFLFIESVMLSNHPIVCWPLLLPSIFPSIRVFSNELFPLGGQSIGASVSTSVLPMHIQGWFPLGLTGLITLLSKGISKVFSSTTVLNT